MPSLVNLNHCDITTVELQFGMRFSDNERYVLSNFSKSEIEVIARYELLKMRVTLTEKLHRAQRQFEMAEIDTEKHFLASVEVDQSERKLAEVEERLGIKN